MTEQVILPDVLIRRQNVHLKLVQSLLGLALLSRSSKEREVDGGIDLLTKDVQDVELVGGVDFPFKNSKWKFGSFC